MKYFLFILLSKLQGQIAHLSRAVKKIEIKTKKTANDVNCRKLPAIAVNKKRLIFFLLIF